MSVLATKDKFAQVRAGQGYPPKYPCTEVLQGFPSRSLVLSWRLLQREGLR